MTKSKAETAMDNDELHLVSAVDAAVAERDEEEPRDPCTLDAEAIIAQARANAVLAAEDRDFEWRTTQNDCVVCPEQRPIAIYTNPYGQAVIRQERSWDEEDDPFICIGKHYLQDVIDRLQAILGEG